MLASTGQFAGHKGSFSLGQVLRGGDVVACDLSLLRGRRWQLLVLYLGLRHVVIPRVEVLLLWRHKAGKSHDALKHLQSFFQPY